MVFKSLIETSPKTMTLYSKEDILRYKVKPVDIKGTNIVGHPSVAISSTINNKLRALKTVTRA